MSYPNSDLNGQAGLAANELSKPEKTIRVKNVVLPLSLSPIGRIVEFRVAAYRIPARGEWFLNKLDEPVKAKSTSLSKRARRKPILQRTK